MAVLARGANAALTREVPSLRRLVIGVAWQTAEPALDDNLVVAALLCDADGQVRDDRDLVFFNQLASPDLSVQQLTAALDGDQEQIEIDLPQVPAEVDRILVVAYVNEGQPVRRTLGRLRSLTVRALDGDGDVELVRSEDLAPPLTDELALVLAVVYRRDGWKFRVRGDAYPDVRALAADYGLPL